MAISTKLEIRQSQSLVMTPQLMQAIKLLQLSNLDLVAYVDAELERNPLLERTEGEPGREGQESGEGISSGAETAGNVNEASSETSPDNGGDDWASGPADTSAESIASSYDTEVDNVFPEDVDSSASSPELSLRSADNLRSAASSGTVGEDYNLEAFVSDAETLTDFLTDQMNLALGDPVDKLIGQHLINSLDDNGYLLGDLEEAAGQLGVDQARLQSVLAILQGFEPSGVFARNLAECLSLQLQERNHLDPAMVALIENIELLAKRDYAALKRVCEVDDEDLADMIAEIKSLDPKPGSVFGSSPVQPLVPDVIVRHAADGGWNVELNSETLPKVLVNQTYYASITRTARNETERTYLTDCLQTANWLVKSLDQRAKTILRVATEIVRQQDHFLTEGIEYLRPLNLKSIADAISMHESTVSRVTSNKYMATPRGIFELKYFFSSAISSTEGGDAHSAEAVRHKIKHMIDTESPDAILSDDTIVKLLKDEGIDIARRTVAKYRESMRISSSVQRRREKRSRL